MPPLDTFDWIQLKSGEWLKGRIKILQNDQLEFDSEELDDQVFDWEDVRQLRSGEAFLYFEDRSTRVGEVVVDEDSVEVKGAEVLVLPRRDLVGLSPGLPREVNYWTGKVSLGLTLSSGNTDRKDIAASASFRRRTPTTRGQLDYLGNLGVDEGEETVNNHRATAFFDWFFARRWFFRPAYLQYSRDPFQNLDGRLLAGVGVGHDVLDRRHIDWSLSLAPIYQYTRYVSVEPGRQQEVSSPGGVFSSVLEADLTRRVELDWTYQAVVSSKEAGRLTQSSVVTFEIEVTRILDVDLSFIWERTEQPQALADGTVPLKNDYRLQMLVGVDF